MLTLEQLTAFLGSGSDAWAETHAVIAHEAQGVLDDWTGKPLKTVDLARRICPDLEKERGEKPIVFRKLIHVLQLLAKKELASYVEKSKRPTRIGGVVVYPWLWRGPLTQPEQPPMDEATRQKILDDYWKTHGGKR